MKAALLLFPIMLSCHKGNPRPELISIQGRNGEIARAMIVNGVRNGEAHLKDTEGNMVRSGHYLNGVKQGTWTETKNGRLFRTIDFNKGKFHGTIKTYYTSGQLKHLVEMSHGLRHGAEKTFYSDGAVQKTFFNELGSREGKYEHWTRNEVEHRGNYIKGQYCKDQKCGTWTKSYPNGQTRWAVDLVNGERHGEMNFWNDEGELTEIWTYHKGTVVEKRAIE